MGRQNADETSACVPDPPAIPDEAEEDCVVGDDEQGEGIAAAEQGHEGLVDEAEVRRHGREGARLLPAVKGHAELADCVGVGVAVLGGFALGEEVQVAERGFERFFV